MTDSNDIQRLEQGLHALELAMRDLELRLTLRFGGMLVAAVAILGSLFVMLNHK